MTGLSARYFDRLRKDGVLNTYQTLGGQHRFRRDEILKHINGTHTTLEPTDNGQVSGSIKNS
jgi:hypothetical protein